MNKAILLMIFSVFISSACKAEFIDHVQVSLIKLSVQPERFEGKKIIVSGVMVAKNNEAPLLYFTEDSYKSNTSDFIVLNSFPSDSEDAALKNCTEGCNLSAIGVFEYSKYNSPMDMIGFLDNVSKVIFW